ncbi:MAG: T9SS type A sorting domain-containing protein [Bacteroidetes bacterium]|nr:T9SS type A sorting domain-containing protein [Bacteroidota bacterium]
MRHLRLFLLLLPFTLFSFLLKAQKPDTIWTKSLGGSMNDCGGYDPGNKPKLAKNLEGELFIGGSTESSDGYFPVNKGSVDCFVIKLNSDGDTLWSKTFGGSSADYLTDIIALNNGGAIFCGYSFSIGSELGVHHGLSDEEDGFITKIDSLGNIVWSKQYGGFNFNGMLYGNDLLHKIIDLGSGSFIALGQTNSNNGDFILDMTKFNCGWILKIDSLGNILKNGKFAHPDHNEWNANVIFDGALLTDNSSIITHGETRYFGNAWKIWTIKIDTNCTVLWQNNYGCNSDNLYGAITAVANSNAVFTATVYDNSGDVNQQTNGFADIWVVKINSGGTIINQKVIGGSGYELPSFITTDENENIFVGGMSNSHAFDPGIDSLGSDFFAIKFNSNLDTLWSFKVGGSQADYLSDIIPITGESVFFAVGKTDSQDGYIHGTYGLKDIWLSKIYQSYNNINELNNNEDLLIYPNPNRGNFIVEGCDVGSEIMVYNILGETVYKSTVTANQLEINLSYVSSGIYLVKAWSKTHSLLKKIVVN